MSTQTSLTHDHTSENPFKKVQRGVLSAPTHDEWEYNGVAHTENDSSMEWQAPIHTPGFEWSDKTLLVVEHTEFCPDKSFDAGFAVGLYPFAEDGTFEGVIQPRLTIGTYHRLRDALETVQRALTKVAGLEPGDGLIINGQPVQQT